MIEISLKNNEFVITGSTVLYFHGIIEEYNDLDIIVHPSIFNNNLKLKNVDICNEYEYFSIDLINEIFENAVFKNGYLLMSFDHLLDYYRFLNRSKDIKKIKLIEQFKLKKIEQKDKFDFYLKKYTKVLKKE